jgi:hypothetical protein
LRVLISLACVAVLLSGACSNSGQAASPIAATGPEPTSIPAPPTPVTAPPTGETPGGTAPVSVRVPTTIPANVSPPETLLTGSTLFDYAAVAGQGETVDTPLGRITWFNTSVVPSDWLYAGFPTPSFVTDPFSYDRSWQDAADAAPCCLSVTRTDGGWLGIGGVDDGGRCSSSAEIWSSADGEMWELQMERAMGTDGPCDVANVVEFGGSVAVLGVGESASGGRVGAVWVSRDLLTWIRTDLDFEKQGMDTYVSSVVASPSGWGIFGMRVSHEPTSRSETGIRLGPYPFEWAGWFSSDGATWKPVNMAEMFGLPWCRPVHPAPCGRIEATVIRDGLVVYVYQAADSTNADLRDGWALWVGVLEDRVS